MMVLFQYLEFLRIEDLDLHNLAVKKASSLLLISLDYLYQIICKYTCGITSASKRKRFSFVINMTSGYRPEWW
jgi:hypothetical protein